MATPSQPTLNSIARKLVLAEIITEVAALEAAEMAHKERMSFVHYVVTNGIIKAQDITRVASAEFGIPMFELNALELEEETIKSTNKNLLRQHKVIPLRKRGNRLYVGLSDPTNLNALDEIKFNVGMITEPVIVDHDKLLLLIEDIIEDNTESLGDLDEDLDEIDLDNSGEDIDDNIKEESAADETPVVRFVNKMLLDAIKKGASDIHLEPYEKFCRVRFRVDGILSEVAKPPLSMVSRLIARVKVMSSMDISEKRAPQDGRIKMRISRTRAIDFRVNTCPTLFGEKIVMRILDANSAMLGIDKLGYEPVQKEAYLKALSNPYGMILVTGPTGSGKTVSLYTGLNILNTIERNISTAEDPAEINLPGINQVNVNAKQGLDFGAALKAFLRQDPDVIMVGEIRDLETANIAIKAAQTGHMVMSTLHTNDAPQTLARLLNMGVPAFNIASALTLIIAQRLARRLCDQCKVPDDIPETALLSNGFKREELDKLKLYKAVGCRSCNDGYRGRVGIYQVMPISDQIARIIMEGGNPIQIADQAHKEGIKTIRESGLDKVRSGVTSLAECNRVTMD